MFHRCVIAVIGVLAVSTLAAAGPIKFGDAGPSLDVAELRASGVRMDSHELRALFFRGGSSRNAAASCADCLAAESSLSSWDRADNPSAYQAVFPFSAARLANKPSANPAAKASPATKLKGGGDSILVADLPAAPPLSSNEAVAPGAALVEVAAVPEPGTFALMGTGLACAWLLRRQRGRSQEG